MNEIFIECPKTGQLVSTGVAVPRGATLGNNTIVCPQCGEPHTWNAEDAFYMDENGNRDPYLKDAE